MSKIVMGIWILSGLLLNIIYIVISLDQSGKVDVEDLMFMVVIFAVPPLGLMGVLAAVFILYGDKKILKYTPRSMSSKEGKKE